MQRAECGGGVVGLQTHYYHLLAAQLHLEVQGKNPFPPLCMLKMGQVPFEYLEDLLFYQI